MIEIDKTPRFKTKDGALHMTLEAAKIHAIEATLSDGLAAGKEMDVAVEILKNSDAIIAILKMKPRKQKAKSTKKPAVKKTEPAKV